MKVNKHSSLPRHHLAVAGLLLLVSGFLLGSQYPAVKKTDDRTAMIDAIEKLPQGAYGFPKSNLEWLAANVGMTPKSFMKSSLLTTTVTGKVGGTSGEHGSLPIVARYYYVGTPGTYEYDGAITLSDPEGESRSIYFSPKRMKEMKVFAVRSGKLAPSEFAAIEAGDTVEIEETVDLSRSNINDDNLIGITVRILK